MKISTIFKDGIILSKNLDELRYAGRWEDDV